MNAKPLFFMHLYLFLLSTALEDSSPILNAQLPFPLFLDQRPNFKSVSCQKRRALRKPLLVHPNPCGTQGAWRHLGGNLSQRGRAETSRSRLGRSFVLMLAKQLTEILAFNTRVLRHLVLSVLVLLQIIPRFRVDRSQVSLKRAGRLVKAVRYASQQACQPGYVLLNSKAQAHNRSQQYEQF